MPNTGEKISWTSVMNLTASGKIPPLGSEGRSTVYRSVIENDRTRKSKMFDLVRNVKLMAVFSWLK